MSHAEPAAQSEVVAGEPLALEQRDDADIVGQNVDRVVVRRRQADLELAGKIGAAVQGLTVLLAGVHLFAIDPDLMVGPRAGREFPGQHAGVLFQPRVNGIANRSRVGGQIADHVAAGAQSGKQRGVDVGDGGLEVGLDDTVKLEALPGGDPQAAIGVSTGQRIHGQVLVGGQPSSGNLHADHALILFLEPALLALRRRVPVVLLVGAVEFQNLVIRLRKGGGLIGQILDDRAAEITAAFLYGFDLGKLLGVRHGAPA